MKIKEYNSLFYTLGINSGCSETLVKGIAEVGDGSYFFIRKFNESSL